MIRFTGIRMAVLAALLTGMGSVGASELKTHKIEGAREVSATVDAVDQKTRIIILKNAEGDLTAVQAGPEVRNLAQVKKGDVVKIQYYEAFAAEIKMAGSEKHKSVVEGAARAKLGDKPGMKGVTEVKVTVTIDAINLDEHAVAFTDPDGVKHLVVAERPEGQKFIKQLKKGDLVDLTYTEAVAVSVEAAK